ncbi:PIN domain-containing protein [Nanoarchaeota archaeon]
MKELISALEEGSDVDYLLDTCFVLFMIERGHTHKLESFCENNKVGMSSFNLAEIDHVHRGLKGTVNHHLRDFLKKRLIVNVLVDVRPGEREREKEYVSDFDEDFLRLVRDPSDAVLLVQALRLHATVLTRDKHHIFTAVAENYVGQYGISVLNDFP